MIDKFLKAKHWQLFALMFVVPFGFQFIMMAMMFANIGDGTNPDSTKMFDMMKFFPLLTLFYGGLLLGWFWSIAIGLQDKIPEYVTMKTQKFKFFFFIPTIYITLLCLFMTISFNGIGQGVAPSGWIILIIFPLHLLSMFGMFYSLYFVAKTIKTIELQREVNFSDFVGEFFLLWFYPVGVWILQPRINEVAEKNDVESNA